MNPAMKTSKKTVIKKPAAAMKKPMKKAGIKKAVKVNDAGYKDLQDHIFKLDRLFRGVLGTVTHLTCKYAQMAHHIKYMLERLKEHTDVSVEPEKDDEYPDAIDVRDYD